MANHRVETDAAAAPLTRNVRLKIMPEQSIRSTVRDFAQLLGSAGTPAGKEDVYLACREFKGVMKASLHQSGSWHLAYDAGFFDTSVRQEDRTNEGRFIDKWQTPAHLAPGVLLAFRIVTRCGAVFTSQPEMSGIFSAPKPAEGRAIEFDLFLVEPMIVLSGWPGKERMKTEFVGSYTLPSGRTVWIVYREIPMPQLPQLRGTPKYFEGRGPEDLTGDT